MEIHGYRGETFGTLGAGLFTTATGPLVDNLEPWIMLVRLDSICIFFRRAARRFRIP